MKKSEEAGEELNKFEIFLFRHGKTLANEKSLYCGKSDPPLSEGGREELLKKTMLPDISKCRLVTSPLRRASQTLGLLYPSLSALAEVDAGFQEIDFGDFEMKSYEELKNDERYQEWVKKEVDRIQESGNKKCENPFPNGESYEQMTVRVIKSLENLLKNYRSVALFTHSGPISAIMQHFFPNEQKSIYEWKSDFGEGYRIRGKLVSESSIFFDFSSIIYEKIP